MITEAEDKAVHAHIKLCRTLLDAENVLFDKSQRLVELYQPIHDHFYRAGREKQRPSTTSSQRRLFRSAHRLPNLLIQHKLDLRTLVEATGEKLGDARAADPHGENKDWVAWQAGQFLQEESSVYPLEGHGDNQNDPSMQCATAVGTRAAAETSGGGGGAAIAVKKHTDACEIEKNGSVVSSGEFHPPDRIQPEITGATASTASAPSLLEHDEPSPSRPLFLSTISDHATRMRMALQARLEQIETEKSLSELRKNHIFHRENLLQQQAAFWKQERQGLQIETEKQIEHLEHKVQQLERVREEVRIKVSEIFSVKQELLLDWGVCVRDHEAGNGGFGFGHDGGRGAEGGPGGAGLASSLNSTSSSRTDSSSENDTCSDASFAGSESVKEHEDGADRASAAAAQVPAEKTTGSFSPSSSTAGLLMKKEQNKVGEENLLKQPSPVLVLSASSPTLLEELGKTKMNNNSSSPSSHRHKNYPDEKKLQFVDHAPTSSLDHETNYSCKRTMNFSTTSTTEENDTHTSSKNFKPITTVATLTAEVDTELAILRARRAFLLQRQEDRREEQEERERKQSRLAKLSDKQREKFYERYRLKKSGGGTVGDDEKAIGEERQAGPVAGPTTTRSLDTTTNTLLHGGASGAAKAQRNRSRTRK
ncbi:unnamed protein product [Amoebophrya sp. A120]|nr:unnamed protein product [Amoebophrya sp. A120]|eukprot:GSA120T00020928001.1